MIRRTLALAGAAVLAVGLTGLAGPPAAADSGITQAGQVVINEVGAELNTTFNGDTLVGGAIELQNIGTNSIDVSGWRVTGCTTSSSFDVTIPVGTPSIPVDGHYLIGDFNYAAEAGDPADRRFPSGGVLLQAAGGAQLQDNSSPQRVTVDEMAWGPDDPGVACATPSANVGELPTDTQTINRGTPVLRDPTLEGSS